MNKEKSCKEKERSAESARKATAASGSREIRCSSDRALRKEPEAAVRDRELLELAALAAGMVTHRYCEAWKGMAAYTLQDGYYGPTWNPLTDDGDALRLAVKLRMRVDPWGAGASAVVFIDNVAAVAEPHYGDDPERATRRAIVRAAAAIGSELRKAASGCSHTAETNGGKK